MNRRIFTKVLALTSLLMFAGGVNAQSWQRYTIKGEEFSITLPTVPAMTTYEITTRPLARSNWHRHLGAYAEGVVYTIYSLDDGKPDQALKRSIEGFRSNQKSWERGSEQDLTQDGFAGKQFRSLRAIGGTVQVFATKKRFYQFEAFGADAADPRVTRFFSSLLLGKNQEGVEVSDGIGIPFVPAGESPSDDVDTPITSKEADRKVALIMKLEPTYTEVARRNGITGTVVIKAVFSRNGNVENIRVMSGLPSGLTEQATEAAQKIKFIPAVKDGKFVSMWMQLEYNFNLY